MEKHRELPLNRYFEHIGMICLSPKLGARRGTSILRKEQPYPSAIFVRTVFMDVFTVFCYIFISLEGPYTSSFSEIF
jgi:hypothetical protein